MATWVASTGLTVLQVFRQQAERNPEKVFCRFDEGPWHTYGELWAASCRYRGALEALGVKRGDRCSVFMSKRFEFLAAMLGIQLAGAIYVPINAEYGSADMEPILEGC